MINVMMAYSLYTNDRYCVIAVHLNLHYRCYAKSCIGLSNNRKLIQRDLSMWE